jgi:HAD superfamily hydrolase (TIGR01509 family)
VAGVNPGTVRAVVFDLDGLLIDTEPVFRDAAARLLAGHGIPPDPAFMQSIMGVPGRDALPRFRDHFRLTVPLEEVERGYRHFFFEMLKSGPAPLMRGASELLAALDARDIPKVIATSSGRDYVRVVFGPHGLLDRFAFVLTCEDVTHGKPHPEVYELAARRLGLPPAEVLVLEDSPVGMRAAKAAGCRCAVVPHEQTPRAELTVADAVVESLTATELWQMIGLPGHVNG